LLTPLGATGISGLQAGEDVKFRLPCRGWDVDCALHQGYKVSVIMVLLIMGMGQNCPKTPPIQLIH
jgi:hypothetical protein